MWRYILKQKANALESVKNMADAAANLLGFYSPEQMNSLLDKHERDIVKLKADVKKLKLRVGLKPRRKIVTAQDLNAYDGDEDEDLEEDEEE